MPQISVIVPVYNVEKYLHRCIDSILVQTFEDFELILIDDGSPDRCGAICDEYAEQDNRIHVIHQENRGLSAARNAGIDWVLLHRNSQWLSFVDSDDWIHPQYLEFLLSAVQSNHVLISVCSIEKVDKMNKVEMQECSSYVKKSEELYLEYAKKIVNVSACGKLYNIKCFDTIRYPLNKQWEDLATTYKIILSVPKCAVINQSLYYYYNNPEGIVKRSWSSNRLDELEAYETQLKFFEKQERWKDIYDTLQLTYIKAISYSYFMERESDMDQKSKKYYGKLLSRKMRYALKQYNDLKISFKENLGIYETAYPHLMSIYWHGRGIINKLKSKN